MSACQFLLTDGPPLADALTQLFGRLHPLSVHFPIALLLVAALFEGLTLLRGGDSLRRAGALCLWVGTAGAVLAGATGWVHEAVEPSREADVELHRWLGVAAAALALVASALALAVRGARPAVRPLRVYRASLFLAALLVAGTGKVGGEMVWGSDWYFEPFEERPRFELPPIALPAAAGSGADEGGREEGASQGAVAPRPEDGPVSYARTIQPILAARCYDCHGPTGKADGDLRLSDLVTAQEEYFGFDWDALVVPGDPARSALYAVVVLPREHDQAMPPEGEGEPLTDAERALLARWIAEGSDLAAMVDG